MKKIEAKFYVKSKTFFGKCIRFQQKWITKLPKRYSDVSHMELWFPYKYIPKGTECTGGDNRMFRIGDDSACDRLAVEHGICWSSSEMDGGTRFKVIQINSENWKSIEIPMKPKQIKMVTEFCLRENGQGYAVISIAMAQVLNINFVRRGYWFCNHACMTGIFRGLTSDFAYDFIKRFTHMWNPGLSYKCLEENFKFKNK